VYINNEKILNLGVIYHIYYICGKTLKKSCEMAIKYVNHSIGTGPRYGKGHGPINHLNSMEIKKKFK